MTGFHFKTSAFLEQTFSKNEIFDFESLKWNISDFIIEEVRSALTGRCYMVCYSGALKKNKWIYIQLKKYNDFKGNQNQRQLMIYRPRNLVIRLSIVPIFLMLLVVAAWQ